MEWFLYSTQRRIRINSPFSTCRGCDFLHRPAIMNPERREAMNQMVTGKFIASERKRKGYTQRQLADLLQISDKTVSKWERGNGFPEVSLLLPLCNELDITVNELLSGERVSEEDYQKKAEENMVNMIQEREENKKKAIMTIVTGTTSTAAFITLILVAGIYADAIALPVRILLVCIGCAIFGLGLVVAMEGERTVGYYKCKACGELFIPTFGEYVFGMHMLATRHLKCPKCGRKTWCRKVLSKNGI